MREEIFGPVLALITIKDLNEGIDFVNTHYTSKAEHPLALYIFSKCKEEQSKILKAIPSGGVAINEVIKQSANYYHPFGGVGTSGMNAYYGKFGFDFFSHYRGTLIGNNFSTLKYDPSVWVAHPPYNKNKLLMFRFIGKVPIILDQFKQLVPLLKFVIPMGFALSCFVYPGLLDALLELNLKSLFKWIADHFR